MTQTDDDLGGLDFIQFFGVVFDLQLLITDAGVDDRTLGEIVLVSQEHVPVFGFCIFRIIVGFEVAVVGTGIQATAGQGELSAEVEVVAVGIIILTVIAFFVTEPENGAVAEAVTETGTGAFDVLTERRDASDSKIIMTANAQNAAVANVRISIFVVADGNTNLSVAVMAEHHGVINGYNTQRTVVICQACGKVAVAAAFVGAGVIVIALNRVVGKRILQIAGKAGGVGVW